MVLSLRVISIFSRRPPSHIPIFRRYATNTTTTMAQLKVHNSLKPGPAVPFVPIEEGKASWYVCGPTVYDHSHLGHARNYVSTDIIRRIMQEYFGFKVKFVMNITDVDDKVRPRMQLKILC
jgi:cysteinyl-tRNA synthetase